MNCPFRIEFTTGCVKVLSLENANETSGVSDVLLSIRSTITDGHYRYNDKLELIPSPALVCFSDVPKRCQWTGTSVCFVIVEHYQSCCYTKMLHHTKYHLDW